MEMFRSIVRKKETTHFCKIQLIQQSISAAPTVTAGLFRYFAGFAISVNIGTGNIQYGRARECTCQLFLRVNIFKKNQSSRANLARFTCFRLIIDFICTLNFDLMFERGRCIITKLCET